MRHVLDQTVVNLSPHGSRILLTNLFTVSSFDVLADAGFFEFIEGFLD